MMSGHQGDLGEKDGRAEAYPPSHVFEQVALTAAEVAPDYFS
jgi:hypothetical protein